MARVSNLLNLLKLPRTSGITYGGFCQPGLEEMYFLDNPISLWFAYPPPSGRGTRRSSPLRRRKLSRWDPQEIMQSVNAHLDEFISMRMTPAVSAREAIAAAE